MTSAKPLKCYGDSVVLSKLKLTESVPNEKLVDILGDLGAEIPATFRRVDKLLKHFAVKYKQKGE